MANSPLSRRSFIKQVPLVIAGSAIPLPALANSLQTVAKPEFEDLTRYYAFLWTELSELSKEMGVDVCDFWTAHRNGDAFAVHGVLDDQPPSSRALGTLQHIKIGRDTLKSERLAHASNEIDAAIKYTVA